METVLFLHRNWYLFVGLLVGGIVVAVLFVPVFRARSATSVSFNHYLKPIPLAASVLGLACGAFAVSLLDAEVVFIFLVAACLLTILFGWALMFENDAVRFAGWFRFGGFLQPVPERMARPVRHSWALICLLFVAGLAGGVCVHLLVLASA